MEFWSCTQHIVGNVRRYQNYDEVSNSNSGYHFDRSNVMIYKENRISFFWSD